ncbi:MAG: CinA family nicotinamide mononucleotide deamidase-related protein [Proteobacteria bacterium]|nr:MAG: CinA family nicotinamide mononucleotide deamidase-related protein [Pseudomonadota bacterium]
MANYAKGVFLLSIGDELLDGRTQNTNASWIGEQLRLAGVPVAEVRCVSDRLEDIVRALEEGRNFPLVISTGGLGPTNDDRTLEGAATAFGRPLRATPESLNHVRSRYEARNLELTEIRLRLANLPEGARVLQNPTGTAPGVELEEGATSYYFLPGPPNECRPMFTADILPLAKAKVGEKQLVRRELWRTFGKGEGDIYARVEKVVERFEKHYPETFTFGIHIAFPGIDLTLEIWNVAGQALPPEIEVKEACAEISAALGNLCFTRERKTLVEAVSAALLTSGKNLSTAESCTGGMLGKLLTDISGSSAYYWGGVISYDNRAKESLLAVSAATLATHGAVSAPTVVEMAEGIRRLLKTDFALALSGVSGPGGGTPEKPVGTIHVALSSAGGTKTLHQVILNGRGSRDQNRVIAVHLALDLLRDALRK